MDADRDGRTQRLRAERGNTVLKVHAAAVTGVAIRANGLCVTSVSEDGKVCVWMYEKGAWVASELEGHKEGEV